MRWDKIVKKTLKYTKLYYLEKNWERSKCDIGYM